MKNVTSSILLLLLTQFSFSQTKMYVHTRSNGIDSIWIAQIDSITFSIEPVPQQGLVAYYPFNGNANDESGNGNNGTVEGATLTTDRFGNSNRAYSFNGIDNLITCGNGSSLQVSGDITVAAWVVLDSSNGGTIVNKYGGSSSTDAGWLLSGRTGRIVSFDGRDGNDIYWWSGPSDSLNVNWHFVVGQRQGYVWKIYVDGALQNDSLVGTTGSLVNAQDLRIGRQSNLPGAYFKGKIDDIRIYNRALTDYEIQVLYHEGRR